MAASTTITIRVRPDVKEKLDRIATDTQRSKSFLASEAVAAYVERELEIIEGIKRGMADVAAGRVVPHGKAMAEIYAAIDTAEAQRTDKTCDGQFFGPAGRWTISRSRPHISQRTIQPPRGGLPTESGTQVKPSETWQLEGLGG